MDSTPQTNTAAQTAPETTLKPSQTWDANAYAANGRFVADLAGEVFAMLNPQPGEHILDLGCGDGALTERIAATGAIVTGCDADPSMLQAAAARNLTAVRADMRALPFNAEFNAVFSNAALHWVTDQDSVLRGVHRALLPGGRFVAEMGGLGNIAAIRTALSATLQPYNIDPEQEAASLYPSVAAYTRLLGTNGFQINTITLTPRPTPLKSGMDQWLRTFRTAVFARLNEADREAAIAKTVALLEPILRDTEGNWWGDYVRLRFHATRL
jgi:trans-aconitate methyltransferase